MEILTTVLLTIGVFTFLGCWAAALVMIRNDVFGDRRSASASAVPSTPEQSSVRELETSGAR